MSARERNIAREKAMNKCEEAFWRGESIESNPYKKSMWGNGYSWDLGWQRAFDAHNKGIKDSRYSPEDSTDE